jgi:hypothetical protein
MLASTMQISNNNQRPTHPTTNTQQTLDWYDRRPALTEDQQTTSPPKQARRMSVPSGPNSVFRPRPNPRNPVPTPPKGRY